MVTGEGVVAGAAVGRLEVDVPAGELPRVVRGGVGRVEPVGARPRRATPTTGCPTGAIRSMPAPRHRDRACTRWASRRNRSPIGTSRRSEPSAYRLVSCTVPGRQPGDEATLVVADDPHRRRGLGAARLPGQVAVAPRDDLARLEEGRDAERAGALGRRHGIRLEHRSGRCALIPSAARRRCGAPCRWSARSTPARAPRRGTSCRYAP